MGTLDDLHQNGLSKGTPETLWEFAKAYANNTFYSASMFGLKNIANWRQDTSNENSGLRRALYAFSPVLPFSGYPLVLYPLGILLIERPADNRYQVKTALLYHFTLLRVLGLELRSASPFYLTG